MYLARLPKFLNPKDYSLSPGMNGITRSRRNFIRLAILFRIAGRARASL